MSRHDTVRADLSDELVDSLVAPHDRFRVWDTVVTSLSVRVTLRGTRSFYVTKHPRGSRRSIAGKDAGKDDRILINRFIGTFPDLNVAKARTEATRLIDAIDNGFMPLPKRRTSRLRREQIVTLVSTYLANHATVDLPSEAKVKEAYDHVVTGTPVSDHLVARAVRELGLLD